MSPPKNIDSLQAELIHFSKEGDLAIVARILSTNRLSREQCSPALYEAADRGSADCVQLLIPFSNTQAGLRAAAGSGHGQCVSLLIPFSNPQAGNSAALRLAASFGHVECVKLLMPFSNAEELQVSNALWFAAAHGHAECVSLLAPACEATSLKLDALRHAAMGGHAECVRLLIHTASFAERKEILASALWGGDAALATVLLDADPRLLGEMNFRESLLHAQSLGHAVLAMLLSSIIEHEALSKTVPIGGPQPSPRLGMRL